MKDNCIKVLLIEDNPDDARLIREMLSGARSAAFKLEHLDRLSSGLERLAKGELDVVLLDLGLSDSQGLDTIDKVYAQATVLPIVVLAGLDDEAVGVQAVQKGAEEYLVKGQMDSNLLVRSLRYAIERKRLEEALRESEEQFRATFEQAAVGIAHVGTDGKWLRVNQKLCDFVGYTREELLKRSFQDIAHLNEVDRDVEHVQRMLAGEIQTYSTEKRYIRKDGSEVWVNLTASLAREPSGNPKYVISVTQDITRRKLAEQRLEQSLKKLEETLEQTVHTLASTIEQRDPYTAGHQRRVAHLACAIANAMGLPEELVDGIEMAGIVHDIGKIVIPSEILSSPRKLTEIEFNLIKTHPQAGCYTLETIEFPWPVAKIVLQHHERMNGSGYPSGLKGIDILLEARILAVADVVEAMSSHRPYRPALGIDKALEEISKKRGILYDPQAVDACLTLFTEKKFKLGQEMKAAFSTVDPSS